MLAEEVATEVTDTKATTRVRSPGADRALRAELDSPRPRPLWPAPPRPAATHHVTGCNHGRWYRPPDGRIPCCGPGEVPERLLAKESKESSQFHPNCLDPGANNAAQTWDLLLPLGDQ